MLANQGQISKLEKRIESLEVQSLAYQVLFLSMLPSLDIDKANAILERMPWTEENTSQKNKVPSFLRKLKS